MTTEASLKADARYYLMRAMWEEVPAELLGLAWIVDLRAIRLRFVYSRYGPDQQQNYGFVEGQLIGDMWGLIDCTSATEVLPEGSTLTLEPGESWFFARAGLGVTSPPDEHPLDEAETGRLEADAPLTLHRALVGLVTPGLRGAFCSVADQLVTVRLAFSLEDAHEPWVDEELQRRVAAQLGPDVAVNTVVESESAPAPLRSRAGESTVFLRDEGAYE